MPLPERALARPLHRQVCRPSDSLEHRVVLIGDKGQAGHTENFLGRSLSEQPSSKHTRTYSSSFLSRSISFFTSRAARCRAR